MTKLLLGIIIFLSWAPVVRSQKETDATVGTCPKPLHFGHCAAFCLMDSDCTKGEICCSNGCGRDCFKPCKPIKCAPCPEGYTRSEDLNGCPTCICRVCPPSNCRLRCRYGFRKGSNGCPSCWCNDKPICPVFRCSRICPNGYQRDRDGCQTCRCKPRAPCPPFPICHSTCRIQAIYGCPKCVCPPEPVCPKINCKLTCVGGYVKNERGCTICQCKETPQCPPIGTCGKHCRVIKPTKGCPFCNCPKLSASFKSCPLVLCEIFCPNGHVYDNRGCKTCKCRPRAPCPSVGPCHKNCKIERTVHGCPICQCPIKRPCPQIYCLLPCPYGYEKDKYGCQTCTCKLKKPCPPKKYCSKNCKVVQNRYGCEECICPRCASVVCKEGCQVVFDYKGCIKCKCRSSCPEFQCPKLCSRGFETDRKGCKICQCKPTYPCIPPRPCPVQCHFVLDKHSCFRCSCPYICPLQHCQKRCSKYTTDANGCLTCNCKK